MPLTPLLFLSPRVPWPLNTGAKIRTHALLSALRERFEVHYAGFLQSDLTRQEAEDYLRGVASTTLHAERALSLPGKGWLALRTLADRRPVTIAKYWHAGLANRVRQWVGEHPDGIVHADHLHMAPYLELGRPALTVIDEHNVESQILERLAEQYRGRPQYPYLRLQANRMKAFEARMIGRASLVLSVSEGDAAQLAGMAPGLPVEVVPNGVDLHYFQPPPTDHAPKPGRLVFIGSMNWLPNHDAMIYFVHEIMPLLKQDSAGEAPWSLDIVGQNPLPAVQALACGEVRVTGVVPDVRPFIREAMIYIVPLRVGGGSRLKILEAFAMGIPVVSTSVGCEGLGTRPEEHLLTADTPADFARAVRRLAQDPALRARLAQNALLHARAHFGWEAIGNRLINLYAR